MFFEVVTSRCLCLTCYHEASTCSKPLPLISGASYALFLPSFGHLKFLITKYPHPCKSIMLCAYRLKAYCQTLFDILVIRQTLAIIFLINKQPYKRGCSPWTHGVYKRHIWQPTTVHVRTTAGNTKNHLKL